MSAKKRLLITGGNSGLGLELSKMYLRAGYEVISLSRKKPKIDIIHVALDYTREESITQAALEIEKNFSDFDICIHCTGIGSIDTFEHMSYTDSQEMMQVNLL